MVEAVTARIAGSFDNRRLRALRDRTAHVDAAVADLGRRLVDAADVDAVVEVALGTGPIIGAPRTALALVVDADHLDLLGAVPAGARPGRHAHGDLEAAGLGPLVAAVATGERSFTALDGSGAMVVSPLLNDERRTVGLLVFTWDRPRSFDAVDRTAIETLTRLCGQALRRAQIASEAQELAAIAESLAVARTTGEVAEKVADHAAAHLGTSVVSLRTFDAGTATLAAVVPSSLPEAIARRYQRIHVDQPLPLADAVRNDEPIWLADRVEYASRYPGLADDARAAGVSGAAAVPLHNSDGSTAGVLAFAWPAGVHFDARFRGRLLTLCDLVASTLERVALYESEHLVVTELQRHLLPTLPTHDAFEVAAHYEPASAAVGMGGDWYEAMVLEDGSLVAVIGDVVGHGVEAIASMARLQHLLTGMIHAGTPLERVLATLNRVIAQDPTFATAALVHVDHRAGQVAYQLAGHPPPLVRLPDGQVELLDRRRQPMLGMALEPVAPLDRVELPRGSLVLAYTDGLIERRGEPIDEGIARLAAELAAAEVGEDLEPSLAQLVDRVRWSDGCERNTVDDVAAVLIRRR